MIIIPQGTVHNNLGPDRLTGPKALDPNYIMEGSKHLPNENKKFEKKSFRNVEESTVNNLLLILNLFIFSIFN